MGNKIKSNNVKHKPTFIDLFAGAGGLSEGFIQAGFEPIAHVEMDKAACNTLRTRAAYHHLKAVGKYDTYVSYLKGEITRAQLYNSVPEEVLGNIINEPIGGDNNERIQKQIDSFILGREVDLIIGGPPCQAYSLVGRARSENNMENDPRNYLFVEYGNYLERYKPKMFVFENVLGLKSAKDGHYLRAMENMFKAKGYQMKLHTLEARNFGVLQNRKRVIILGWQQSKAYNIPDLEAIRSNHDYVVADLLNDLPHLPAGGGQDKYMTYLRPTSKYLQEHAIRNGIDVLTQHIARPHNSQDKEIYKVAVKRWQDKQERLNYNDLADELKTHSNRTSFYDRFKVVAADLPYAQTVVAHISKDGHYYIHPDLNQNRSITVREAARLQSFPDDYYFEGEREGVARTAAFKQIGNAVPPMMAKEIARVLNDLLNGK